MSCADLQGAELQLCRAAEAAEAAATAAAASAARPGFVEAFAQLADAVSGLVVPVVLAVVLWRLWPFLGTLLERRSFTIKVAGFELSAQEATDQLRKQIEDLQTQVAALHEPAHRDAAPAAEVREAPAARPGLKTRLVILWVDDHPENNAFEVATLLDSGHEVVQAKSTEEGLRILDRSPIDVVLSDIGRPEGRDAGLEMLRRMREGGDETPFGFYSSQRSISRNAEEIDRMGAFVATSHFVDLLRGLNRFTTTSEP